jgi:hypothetical protein
LAEYREAYSGFLAFYIKKKYEGYELFISEKLKESLVDFWKKAARA